MVAGRTILVGALATLLPLAAALPARAAVQLELVKDLKAVLFVRSFEGNPAYTESKDLYQARPPGTRRVTVEFTDGEVLVGHTKESDAGRPDPLGLLVHTDLARFVVTPAAAASGPGGLLLPGVGS